MHSSVKLNTEITLSKLLQVNITKQDSFERSSMASADIDFNVELMIIQHHVVVLVLGQIKY